MTFEYNITMDIIEVKEGEKTIGYMKAIRAGITEKELYDNKFLEFVFKNKEKFSVEKIRKMYKGDKNER